MTGKGSCSSWVLGAVPFLLCVLRLIGMRDLPECLGGGRGW